jgi:hypothetical protein
MSKIEVPIRAVVDNPPVGVAWAYQRSKGDLGDLAAPTRTEAGRLVFEFKLQAEPTPDGGARWLGPGVQGPPDKRFFYLNSGTYAGDQASAYGRRAKISLMPIAWSQIDNLGPGQVLEIRFAGTGRDGGPACASIKPTPPGWRVI